MNPWDRRKGETDKAWIAFVAFRDLGLKRTIAATVTVLGRPTGYSRSLDTWVTQYDWRARVAAFDAHLDGKRQQATEETVAQVARRHALAGQRLQMFGQAGIASHFKDGKLTGKIRASDATAALKAGVEIERDAKGMAKKLELGGHDGAPLELQVVDPVAQAILDNPAAREAALNLVKAMSKKPDAGA